MATVLLVEDDELLRELLADHLEAEGFDVVQAADGQEAQKMGATFDAVLCDLVMPNMDGMSFIHWLKSHQPSAKIITLSGADDPRIKEKLSNLGVTDQFSKPLSTQQLDSLSARLTAVIDG